MIEHSHRGSALAQEFPAAILSESQPHAEGHDEWLLDEALAATFPASDPFSISPYSSGPDGAASRRRA